MTATLVISLYGWRFVWYLALRAYIHVIMHDCFALGEISCCVSVIECIMSNDFSTKSFLWDLCSPVILYAKF